MSPAKTPCSPKPARHRCRRCGVGALAAVSATLAFAAAPGVRASTPSSGLEGIAEAVSDTDMAQMRGKYIRPDGVAYFGIQLQSSWENASGAVTAATMLISVDFNGESGKLDSATPHVLVGWSGGCGGCTDSSVDVPVGGGLDTVKGVVQSQQITGSDNRVRNDFHIDIAPQSETGHLDETGLTPIQDSTTVAGGAVQFDVANNSVGLTLLGGNSEMVRQAINGDLGQMAQNVRLSSDFNMVQSNFTMSVGLDQLAQSDTFNIQNAMTAMSGRGF